MNQAVPPPGEPEPERPGGLFATSLIRCVKDQDQDNQSLLGGRFGLSESWAGGLKDRLPPPRPIGRDLRLRS